MGELRRQLQTLRMNQPQSTQAVVELENSIADLVSSQISQVGAAQRRLLKEAYAVFAERTYPPPNDTSLALHTRLAANLYHVVLAQLVLTDELYGLGLEALGVEDLKRGRSSGNLPSVRSSLRSWIVTVRLAGLQDRFNNAVRLDDLQGAKALADRFCYAFKRRVLSDLGFAGVPDAAELADLLCLSESRFDLTYLLPASYGANQADVEERLAELFEAGWYDVVNQPYMPDRDGEARYALYDVLANDLRGAPDDFKPERCGLAQGLQVMLPAFGVVAIDPAAVTQMPFEEHFGRHVLAAYQKAQEQALPGSVPKSLWETLNTAPAASGVDITLCSHCQAVPAWVELTGLAYGLHDQPGVVELQKLFHGSRTEPEYLCQACAAQRALAHGVTAVPSLAQMIRGEIQPDGSIELAIGDALAADGRIRLRLPPLMQQRAAITAEDGLIDLGAAFIRVHRSGADLLDRFPGIAYAAEPQQQRRDDHPAPDFGHL